MRHTFGNVQAVSQFNGVQQVGVEHAGVVGNAHALEALLQLSQLIDSFLHQLRRTVDAAAFLHRQPHFVADFRPVFVTLLVNEIFQPLLYIGGLCIQCGTICLSRLCGALHSLFPGQAAEDHQLGQRVGTQTVGAVQTGACALSCGI